MNHFMQSYFYVANHNRQVLLESVVGFYHGGNIVVKSPTMLVIDDSKIALRDGDGGIQMTVKEVQFKDMLHPLFLKVSSLFSTSFL